MFFSCPNSCLKVTGNGMWRGPTVFLLGLVVHLPFPFMPHNLPHCANLPVNPLCLPLFQLGHTQMPLSPAGFSN